MNRRRPRGRRTAWSVRRPVKPEVAGSNPVAPASRILDLGFGLGGQVAQSVERRSEKPEVDGSTPSLTTNGTGEEVLDSFALSTFELAIHERTESVIFRFENSRIVEVWELLDGSELRRQLVDSAGP